MSDPYYTKLTRTMLSQAEDNLRKAQEYAVESNCYNSPEKIQRIINSVRNEIDRLFHFLENNNQ